MNLETLTSGQVARQAGVNRQTLRYYERRGLLPCPPRRCGGYRQYPDEAVLVLRFVKRAKGLGFTLEQILDLLRLRSDRRANCAAVRERAREKIEDIQRRLQDLEAMRQALKLLVETCGNDGSARDCPILEALESRDHE
ncbi:MAG: MerR family transcriptional regulator [Candidatus Riflebacteria bacterium]|nr:MerR family transcriptional regulator [Candidatus Riflebacteria bacterium]